MQLVRQVLARARLDEAAPAIAYTGTVLTYGTLVRMIDAAAAALETLALRPGSMVLLDIRNPAHHTVVMFALALLGIPTASVTSAFAVDKSGARPALLITDRDDLPDVGVATQRIDERWFAHDPASPADYGRLFALPGFASPDQVVRYVFSSGTTGYPKLVAMTEQVIERRVWHSAMLIGRVDPGAAINLMGFSTVVGMMGPLLALSLGTLLCFPSSLPEALQMTRLFNVRVIAAAVIQIDGLLQLLRDKTPPPSLRMVNVAGARMPLRLLMEARARLCTNIVLGYGSTEMGGMSSGAASVLERYEGSAGYVNPWVTLQAVDAGGRQVPPGTDGILRARSPEMAFYASDSPDQVETIRDGWFYPGDVGRIHADGLVVITGRTTEVINRGGVIVAPELIEEVLRLDPEVKDVAVVGVPSASGIEEIWAAVLSDGPIDPNAIAQRAHPKLNEKVPDRIIRVDAIPRNENGKVQRGKLRETLVARLRS